MATIIDVARMAGVSQGTASNVLNGKGNVSSEKIKAVEEAAKKLGYTINERAKMLRKGSGNIICVIGAFNGTQTLQGFLLLPEKLCRKERIHSGTSDHKR